MGNRSLSSARSTIVVAEYWLQNNEMLVGPMICAKSRNDSVVLRILMSVSGSSEKYGFDKEIRRGHHSPPTLRGWVSQERGFLWRLLRAVFQLSSRVVSFCIITTKQNGRNISGGTFVECTTHWCESWDWVRYHSSWNSKCEQFSNDKIGECFYFACLNGHGYYCANL